MPARRSMMGPAGMGGGMDMNLNVGVGGMDWNANLGINSFGMPSDA